MIDDLPLVRPASLDSNQNIPLEPEKKRKMHKDNLSDFGVGLFESEEAVINKVDTGTAQILMITFLHIRSKPGLYQNLSQVAINVVNSSNKHIIRKIFFNCCKNTGR